MKRRSPPVSSQMLFRMPGCLLSRRSMTSLTVPASTSTISAPAVCFRSGVGMTTLRDMSLSLVGLNKKPHAKRHGVFSQILTDCLAVFYVEEVALNRHVAIGFHKIQ